MRSRVYVAVRCPPVSLSDCFVDRQQQWRASGLLLSTQLAPHTSYRSISAAGAHANAGSVMLRAEERGSTQTSLACYTGPALLTYLPTLKVSLQSNSTCQSNSIQRFIRVDYPRDAKLIKYVTATLAVQCMFLHYHTRMQGGA